MLKDARMVVLYAGWIKSPARGNYYYGYFCRCGNCNFRIDELINKTK